MKITLDVLCGDCRISLQNLRDRSVHCVITSPPYWGLRDYQVDGQLGLEPLHDCLSWARGDSLCKECYVCSLVRRMRAVRRVLRDDGTLWLNLGDSYNAAGRKGHGARQGYKQGTNRARAAKVDTHRPTAPNLKPKDLVGIPWRVALALQADGWYLRQDIIWHKLNPMPESVNDRCTKAHEYLFLFSKSPRYYFDAEAIKEASVGTSTHDLTGPGYAALGTRRRVNPRNAETGIAGAALRSVGRGITETA